MDSELFRQLVADPGRWPYYLLLAAIVIFVLKIINVAAEAAARRLSDKVKERKGLLPLFKAATQLICIALLIYFANVFYWSKTIEQFAPLPTKKPINTCETTVEIVIESGETKYFHFIDSGGYLAFVLQERAILVTSAPDSWGRSITSNEYMYRGIFKMDATDSAVGKPVDMLLETQCVQTKFRSAPKEYSLIRGKAIVVINSEVRCELSFPAQKVQDGKAFLRDLKSLRNALK